MANHNKKKKWIFLLLLLMSFILNSSSTLLTSYIYTLNDNDEYFIKWVDFTVPHSAMKDALKYDIESYGASPRINWIEILACLAAKNGGNFSNYRSKDMDKIIDELENGKTMDDLTENLKYYGYYKEAYMAVLGEFVGEYQMEVTDNDGKKKLEIKYGLRAFSPIAKGFYYSHYDDFGNSRTYGFTRRHQGNDLIANIGTPVIAVESGIIEALGWNRYGGWRIGIRSFDGRRYYYYAHLRKNYPYHKSLFIGKEVKAGDVIGYVGRSGYSTTENTNNIRTAHLHFGMELIFNEAQRARNNEIWINVYHIVELLESNRSEVYKNEETKEYNRLHDIRIIPELRD